MNVGQLDLILWPPQLLHLVQGNQVKQPGGIKIKNSRGISSLDRSGEEVLEVVVPKDLLTTGENSFDSPVCPTTFS
jgi:hypothetical protein